MSLSTRECYLVSQAFELGKSGEELQLHKVELGAPARTELISPIIETIDERLGEGWTANLAKALERREK